MSTNYRVLKFYGSNVMGMKVFAVALDPNIVEVRGANGAGKSSFMEGLPMLIGGKKAMPGMPLRKGESDGFVGGVLVGDDGEQLLVKRRLDGKKPELEVTAAGGFKAPEPQTLLNAFKNDLSFNPGAFCKADPKKQSEMVRKLVGLDFSEKDAERKRLYDERTLTNRELASVTAQRDAIVVPEGTPDKEVSLSDLLAEQSRRNEHNRKNQVERDRISRLEFDVTRAESAVKQRKEIVASLEEQLAQAKSKVESAEIELMQATALRDSQLKTISVLEDQSCDDIQQQMVNAQAVNAAVARVKQKAVLTDRVTEIASKAESLTNGIQAIDDWKAEQLAAAEWPIEGLGITEDGVTFNGIPVEQVNSEKRLRIGIAVCAAMNPSLRAIRIENASLLDKNELAAAKEEAKARDLQLWLEVVSVDPPDHEDAEVIFIANGEVQSGPKIEPEPEKPKRGRKKKTESASLDDDPENPFA